MQHTSVLDARSFDLALGQPVARAARIPWQELEHRVFELADRTQQLFVADTGPEAKAAMDVLERLGRQVKLVTPEKDVSDGRIFRLWRPPEFLEEIASSLEPGRALCLACGAGREAVWLAAAGWQVTAIDLLPDAIAQGQALEVRYAPPGAIPIQWLLADLRQPELPMTGEFDLVTQFLFWSPETPRHLRTTLKSDGTGILEVFSRAYREAKGTRPEGRRWDASTWRGWTVDREENGPQDKTRRIILKGTSPNFPFPSND